MGYSRSCLWQIYNLLQKCRLSYINSIQGFGHHKKMAAILLKIHVCRFTPLVLPECPFKHFFPACFFTIHQNARAVNFASQPGGK